MPWDLVTERWQLFVNDLCRDFRFLDARALRRFRGDRSKLVTYLAETHDLTEHEACETLRDWFTFKPDQSLIEQAA